MFADLESLTSSSLAFGETLVSRTGFDRSRVLLLCLNNEAFVSSLAPSEMSTDHECPRYCNHSLQAV